MKLSNANKKLYLTSTILCLAILVLTWLTFFWEYARVKQTSEDYQKVKLNSIVVEEKRQKFAKLEKDISNLKENSDTLTAMFLQKNAALPLLKGLEDIATQSSCGVEINPADISKIKFTVAQPAQQQKSTSADEETAAANDSQQNATDAKKNTKPDELAALKNYPAFTVTVTGSYGAAVDFLYRMENLPYFIRPLTLDIVPSEKNGQTSSVSSVAQAPDNTGSPSENNGESSNKNITMTLVAVVYGSQ